MSDLLGDLLDVDVPGDLLDVGTDLLDDSASLELDEILSQIPLPDVLGDVGAGSLDTETSTASGVTPTSSKASPMATDLNR